MYHVKAWPFLLLSAFTLIGCSGASDISAVKAAGYDKVPHRLLVTVPDKMLGGTFWKTLATSMAKCGTEVQYTFNFSMPAAKEGHFDAVMQTSFVGYEGLDERYRDGSHLGSISNGRFQFSLFDTGTQKNVWKEQIDFILRHMDDQEEWADILFNSMIKSGLVGPCDPAHAISPPANLVYSPAKARDGASPVNLPQ